MTTPSDRLRRAVAPSLTRVLALALTLSQGAAHATSPTPPTPTPAPAVTVAGPQLQARSWLVIDLNSGQVLAAHNPAQVLPPASLTKLMTAYLTFQALHDGRVRRDQAVRESVEAWRTGGSRMFIDPRVPVTIDQMLFGMIVQSGNDAAMMLAQTVGGSADGFVQMMNRQAAQWGLKETHFADPTGLPDPAHHSSARDLATIATHIIQDYPQDFARYFAVKQYAYNGITQPNRVELLFTDPSVDGMKTGYTKEAGYCMVTTAQRTFANGPRRLLTVVMGAPSERERVLESATLLNWAFQSFDDIRLAAPGQAVVAAPVWKGARDTVGLGLPGGVTVTVPRGQGGHVTTRLQRPDPLVAPLVKGQPIGTLQVSLDGNPLTSIPLQALDAVPPAGFVKRIWDSLRLLIR